MIKIINQFFLFLLLIITLLQCGGMEPAGPEYNILRVALIDNPTNLDPRTYSDVASYRIIELVYDFLIRSDSTGKPQPSVASDWEVTSDTVYIFNLRNDIKFHDGLPLTAYDVEFTFNSILDPELKAPSRKSFEIIEKITVIDSFKIKFKLKNSYAPFLVNAQVGIVPKHICEVSSNILQRKPLGSGPFKFVKWKPDLYIKLLANKEYWINPPNLDGLLINILPEETTRILAIENGEIDFMMNNFPEKFIPRFRKNKGLTVVEKTGSNYVYLGINLRNKYLKNNLVRKAIAHSIDIHGILKNLKGGIHKPAKSLLNPLHWAYNPNLKDYEFNPDLAKKLLDQAGFIDPDGGGIEKRFTLSYKCTDKQLSRQKAQLIQKYLGDVGIQIDIQSYEWGTFFDDIQNGRFDLYSLTWVGINEPDIYYQVFHTDNIGIGANRGGYSNPEIDFLIEKSQRTLDFEERKIIYWKIQEILREDLPYISLWYETNVAVLQKYIKGFRVLPAAEWISFKDVSIENK
jgi:peptide/nickel transport system substrate-binding protein